MAFSRNASKHTINWTIVRWWYLHFTEKKPAAWKTEDSFSKPGTATSLWGILCLTFQRTLHFDSILHIQSTFTFIPNAALLRAQVLWPACHSNIEMTSKISHINPESHKTPERKRTKPSLSVELSNALWSTLSIPAVLYLNYYTFQQLQLGFWRQQLPLINTPDSFSGHHSSCEKLRNHTTKDLIVIHTCKGQIKTVWTIFILTFSNFFWFSTFKVKCFILKCINIL